MMSRHALGLADRDRIEQFALLGRRPRLLDAPQFWRDEVGIAWAATRVGDHCFAASPLGPGWVFDPYARARQQDVYESRLAEMAAGGPETDGPKGRAALARVRAGGHAERVLWAVHQAVLSEGTSLLRMPDFQLAEAVWGRCRERWPRHWRQELTQVLVGLTWLHQARWPDPGLPVLGRDTAVLTHVADLRGREEDQCPEGCPGRDRGRHHHYLVNVGRGLLGVLEQFASDDETTGIRTYDFPIGKTRTAGPSLRRVGKTGRLASVYLPARLGEPDCTGRLTPDQHRLLQALVRETTRTRHRRGRRKEATEAEMLQGNLVPDARGRKYVPCPELAKDGRYVGFNGNKKLHGRGYKMLTEGGWLAKAGYAATQAEQFLDDLAALHSTLRVTAVGLLPSDDSWVSQARMRELARTPAGRVVLGRLHVRVYAPSDYLWRWGDFFAWDEGVRVPGEDGERLLELHRRLKEGELTRRQLATRLGRDPSFVSKLLQGKKSWPTGLLDKALAATMPTAASTPTPSPSVVLEAALGYLRRGWSVVPQKTGAKMPHVRWKQYQENRPSEAQLRSWFATWPEAGVAVILGRVSGLFVLDVDSGSRKPSRYHLYFRHPNLGTKAKATPWHPQLEFRGDRGIVVAPPSLHKSGHRYEWAAGQGLDDLSLPEVPAAVLEALGPRPIKRRSVTVAVVGLPPGKEVSPSTKTFLAGSYADGPNWNERLFRAACDLAGRGWEQEDAKPLLLAAAQPWDANEEEAAQRTIRSAFSAPREPGEV